MSISGTLISFGLRQVLDLGADQVIATVEHEARILVLESGPDKHQHDPRLRREEE